jgi:polysaccharide deacetylase family sporulation protein PdaB
MLISHKILLHKWSILSCFFVILTGCQTHSTEPSVAVMVTKTDTQKNMNSPEVLGPQPVLAKNQVVPAAMDKEEFPFSSKSVVIYSVSKNEKQVALTFDDGPDSRYTVKILDILKKYDVKATFFVIGQHAAANPEVMKRMVKEGHQIGNHSWDHVDLTKLGADSLKDEINKTDDKIKEYTGNKTQLIRAPYGALSGLVASTAAESEHKFIGWSVDTRDWEGVSASQILDNVKKELKPGAIILQHSAGGKHGNLANTVEALPKIIEYLKESGYRMVTVSELLDKG